MRVGCLHTPKGEDGSRCCAAQLLDDVNLIACAVQQIPWL